MAINDKTDRRWTILWLGACILMAFAVQSHNLGAQSLWWDESLSLHRARLTLGDNLANLMYLTDGSTVVATVDSHPPLYFLLLSLTARLLGTSEFALRLPSLAFAILLIPLTYLAGKRLLGEAAGRWAALFVALSPMYLWFSQEARMYTMSPFLALLSFYCMLRLLDRGPARRPWTAAYILATLAMLLTHYLTLLVLVVEILVAVLVVLRNGRLARWMWPLSVVGIAGVLVLAYVISIMPPASPEGGFAYLPLPLLARDVLNSASLGLSVNVNDVLVLDLAFLVVAIAGLAAALQARASTGLPAALILLLYMLVPLGLTYLAGYIRPIYMNSRHLIVMTPAFYLALGAGMVWLRARRWLCAATLGVMLVGIAFSWGQYFGNPIYQKDDHRAWGDFLRARVQPGDVVVVNPAHIAELYQYYAASDAPWVGLPSLDYSHGDATTAVLERLSAEYRNIWLAQSYTPPWGDSNRRVEAWLDGNLTRTLERSFHSYASIVQLVRYATQPALSAAVPAIAVPANVEMGGRLTFLGYDPVNRTAEPGRSLAFRLYLRSEEVQQDGVKVSLRLLDASGQMWAQMDELIAALQPSLAWRDGMIARHDAALTVPLATPAGGYRVEAVVYEAGSGQPLTPGGGVPISLGEVVVAAPKTAPRPEQLPLTQRLAGCAEQLELIGIQLAGNRLSQGDRLSVAAYWQARQQPASDFLALLALVDGRGAVVAEQTQPIAGPAHGTLTWAAGEVVRGEYKLDVPRDLPPGSYILRISLADAATGTALRLHGCGLARYVPGWASDAARLTIVERPRSFTAPAMMYALPARFGDAVALHGYDASPALDRLRAEPGQAISLTLYLQAVATMNQNYTVFLHLVDGAGQIWGQADVPAGGEHPTSQWLPGEVTRTTLSATISPQAPAGALTAIMGLYDPQTGARLPVMVQGRSSDHIELFEFGIAR